jgi:hypothetical protein
MGKAFAAVLVKTPLFLSLTWRDAASTFTSLDVTVNKTNKRLIKF